MEENKTYYLQDENLSVVEDPSGNVIHSYKDLWIWKHSLELVKSIYLVLEKVPSDERFGLTSQLKRAAVSVPSNIAEGWGRNKTGYLLNGLSIARGSLSEIETQLLICLELDYLSQEQVDPLLASINKIGAGILRFINTVESKKG